LRTAEILTTYIDKAQVGDVSGIAVAVTNSVRLTNPVPKPLRHECPSIEPSETGGDSSNTQKIHHVFFWSRFAKRDGDLVIVGLGIVGGAETMTRRITTPGLGLRYH
jgi:hypothetical protein